MDILGSADASRGLPHPGTFNGNPVSATAGIATLELVATEPVIERADAMAARLKTRLRDGLTRMEVRRAHPRDFIYSPCGPGR